MPTPATERQGVGPAAKEVAEHASTLARLELELATLELKRKVAALGVGIGLVVGAGLFLLFALGFGLAAGALSAGFVIAGGVGATMRLIFRRGREGKEKARVGRFAFIDRR